MKNDFSIINGEWQVITPFKINKIVDSPLGLEVMVSGIEGNEISGSFVFENYYGYRKFDEGDLWRRWNDIGVLYSGLYVSKESELLDWSANQSVYGVLPTELKNFLLLSIDDALDVLSDDLPRFNFIEKK